MQILLDFFPLIAFFVVFKLADIFWATGAIIIATGITVCYQWFFKRRINPMHWISAVLVLIFGGTTLILRDQIFIQWKPSIVYWLFGSGFLASQFVGGKPFIQRLMSELVVMSEHHWRVLNLTWVVFFTLLGAANLYVVYHYDQATWVNFKVFGLLGLTVLMVVLQSIWVSKHAIEISEPKDAVRDTRAGRGEESDAAPASPQPTPGKAD